MKVQLSPSNYTFNATAKQITFDAGSTALITSIGRILHVANVTRGVLYFQPQAGPALTGTYAAGVLTLAASTTGHTNGDSLLILIEDGKTALTNEELRAAAVPTAPNISRGSGAIDSNTQRVTLATDGPTVTALTNIDSDLGAPADAAASSDTGTFSIIAFLKRLLSNNGTRQYDWGSGLRQAVSNTSTAAIPLPTLGGSREVMFHASTRCFIRMGDSNVAAASVAAQQLVLEAGERFHIRIPTGTTHFRVIRDTADGNLNVTAVL